MIANPVRGRLNAAFFRLVDGYLHRRLGTRKAALFAGLPPDVIELGPGTGANLRYYRPGTRTIAIEPNPHMHPALARAAARHGVELDIRPVGAEATGLPAASAEAVVCTLVLCTVTDTAAAVAEVRRILRPGGRLVLLEHVAAPDGSALAGLQRVLRRPWRWAFEGCDLTRTTGELVTDAGFGTVDLDRYRLCSVFVPVNEQVRTVRPSRCCSVSTTATCRPWASTSASRSSCGPEMTTAIAAHHAMAAVLRHLFPTMSADNAAAVETLERSAAPALRRGLPIHLADRSRAAGGRLADAVHEWSRTDGGHGGHARAVGPEYRPPAAPDLWRPTPPAFAGPVQPNWGANRTFLPGLVAGDGPTPPLPYETAAGSAFHLQAREVYDTVNALSAAQLDVARYWSDDPGRTSTPSGHWMSILTGLLRARRADLELTARAVARLGVAVADAFVCCWAAKYRYLVPRPITYVNDHIDPAWGPQVPLTTPPFPEYTSGHSVVSGAAARVLTDLFGEVAFVDRTHRRLGLPARRFESFAEAADEAGISRLYGGIHYRQAITEGLRQGERIGAALTSAFDG